MTRTFLLREGSPDPDGVGALRRFAVGPFGSCEEVVEFEPLTHLGYVARKGIPVRSYRADIVLRPDGAGTAITWTASLTPLVPGTGASSSGLYQRVRSTLRPGTRALRQPVALTVSTHGECPPQTAGVPTPCAARHASASS